jgi:capsular exopolysaccharide synthesis family protein
MKYMERNSLPQRITEDFQAIRTNLGLVAGEGIPHILAVTSSGTREGKTTFSINLATSIATSGLRVLLIDGDFRKPDIGAALSLNGKTGGLQKILFETADLQDAVSRVPSIDLDVLTADPFNIPGTFEILARPHTREIIRKISEDYDHVIIDTPPVLVTPDALLWAKLSDAVVMIGYSGQTSGPDLKETYKRLSKIKVRILGTVLNSVGSDAGYQRYGYGYSGGEEEKEKGRKRRNRPLLLTNKSDSSNKA